jgi:hypothetical protein
MDRRSRIKPVERRDLAVPDPPGARPGAAYVEEV